MRNRVFWLSLVAAAAAVLFVAAGPNVRSAEAVTGDVCQLIAWDSTGNVLSDGEVVQGNGEFYVLARVEDDALGFVRDFIEEGPGGELLEQQIGALEEQIADLEEEIALLDPEADADEIAALEAEIEAREEVIKELEEAVEEFFDYNIVTVDSQTGSARIRSYAEVAGFEEVKPRIDHRLISAPGVLTQKVDHMFPDWFADPDGNDLDSISAWLEEVAGVALPSGISQSALDAANVCGDPEIADGWKFADLVCFEAGTFHVTVTPNQINSSSENSVKTKALECPGQVDTATIAASPTVLETQPVGNSSSFSLITVTALDQFGRRIDGAEVTFFTNTCTFRQTGAPFTGTAGLTSVAALSPAGGGTVVTTFSDTEASGADQNFLTNNPLETEAGTAEVVLDCAQGAPGTVKVTAQVHREGADIQLAVDVTLIGPTAANGLSLVLTPESLECGELLIAEATAVDANGKPVSNGTPIFFTTDTSSAIINGVEGAQGSNLTIDGKTKVSIAISPDDPGVHSVIAFALSSSGAVLSQVSETFECESAVAPAAPTTPPVAPPGTGTGVIKPPSTGDAGLAGPESGILAWFGPATVVLSILVLGIFVVTNASYVEYNGRRR
jgi:hypothetical protein